MSICMWLPTRQAIGTGISQRNRGVFEFSQGGEGGAVLLVKERELINTALAVAVQCKWCIAFHVQNAVKEGASRCRLVEAGFQAVVMHGGPGIHADDTPFARSR